MLAGEHVQAGQEREGHQGGIHCQEGIGHQLLDQEVVQDQRAWQEGGEDQLLETQDQQGHGEQRGEGGGQHDRGHGEDQDQVQHCRAQHVDRGGGYGGGAVKKGWSTVRLRKTRNMVPDGLVQVRINNFMRTFPNLGRGPLLRTENEIGDNIVVTQGIMKRKSLDQLKGPEASKRLKK